MARILLLPLVLLLLRPLPATANLASPLCLPRAAAAVLEKLGDPVPAMALARELPVHRDGVDVFDLRMWLEQRGLQVQVLATADTVQRAVRAGVPAVAVRQEAEGMHAVALLAGDATQVLVADERAGQPYRTGWAAALRGLHVAVAVARRGGDPLAWAAAAERAVLRRVDGQFVATGWLRRAAEYPRACPAPCQQRQCELLRRAVAAAPELAEAQGKLRACLAAVGGR